MSGKEKVKINKFGGSCLSDATSFAKTLSIMRQFAGTPSVAVLSAFKGVTDQLIELAKLALEDLPAAEAFCARLESFHADIARQMIKDGESLKDALDFISFRFNKLLGAARDVYKGGLPPHLQDYIVSFGERLSTYLFTCFLRSSGVEAEYLSGEAVITTNAEFGNAMPIMDKTQGKIDGSVLPVLRRGAVAVITGYYAETEDHLTTTLGRGGSDFTATIIANVLAERYDPEVLFWKDVDGLLSANPKIEPSARLIEDISYDEAKELAYFGSKVLHPICLRMTMDKGIPVQIRNFNKDLDAAYTRISKARQEVGAIVKSIACVESCEMITLQGAAMVSLPGIAARLFTIMARERINIMFISQASSENNITFVVNQQDGPLAVKALFEDADFGKAWFDISREATSLVAVVGHGMAYKHGVAGKVFTALGDAGANVRAIAQGSSELNISFLVGPKDLKSAIHALHQEFIIAPAP
ncbi:MAG: aspartate kinase [Candidatus Lokiarchaeota archaeon]|nr:aspartate kinase [Candidatus Lokiarchaeota archaeon]